MWPTSIAVWKRSAPPQLRQRSPSDRLAQVGEARLVVAAVPRRRAGASRCGWRRRRTALRAASRRRRSRRRSRRGRASPDRRRTPRGSRPRSPAARPSPSAAASFAGSSRSSPRTSASTTVPSSFVMRHRLRRRRRVDAEQLGERLDRRRSPGVATSSGAVEPRREARRARHGARHLEVGRVVAVLAGDERVLARARRREEVDRLAAAHHPRLGLHRVVVDPAALEDPVVGALVRAEADLEPGLVAVERVRVLHDELADAEQAAARARLVAILGLEVVPGLRQLLVALELLRVEGERLLVGQRQDELPADAILDVEDLRDLVAAGRLPQLDRREHGREPLLRSRSPPSPRG